MVVFGLVREVAWFIDDIALNENIGRSPSRVFDYVVNGATEWFVKVWTSLTRKKKSRRDLFLFGGLRCDEGGLIRQVLITYEEEIKIRIHYDMMKI